MKIEDLASHLGISRPTVKKYLDAMEKTYLIHLVRPFFTNKRKELVKQQRAYFLDTGMRNAIAKELDKEPTGHLFENYVLTELLKMGLEPRYWRTKSKAEVDFVVERGRDVVPIEVKLQVGRKIGSGLRAFIDRYSPDTAIVVGLKGEEGSRVVGGCDVRFLRVSGLWRVMTGEAVTEYLDER